MSTFIIKIIAIVSMIIDHVAYNFLDSAGLPYLICRGIGRLAFPLFAFLLVEGYFRTRSLKKYFLRLGILAIVSEAAYDFVFSADFLNFAEDIKDQSIIITLLLGLLSILLIDRLKNLFLLNSPMTYTISACFVIILASLVAYFFRVDYGPFGVILIICLYFFRGKPIYGAISFIVLMFIFPNSIPDIEFIGVLAFVPMFLFNGEKGPNDHHLFYLAYPVHLAIIGLIKMFFI